MPKMPKKDKYKLYALNNYAKNDEFIKNGFEEYCIDDLVTKLETDDNGYHMRIDPKKNYIFFGDCDKFDGSFDKFSELLINFLSCCYDIEVSLKDISYTENEGVDGSFHYSIPKYYTSCKKLKEMHAKFCKHYENVFSKKVNKM